MKSVRFLRARSPSELADLLGLNPVDAIEFEFRAKLLKKIIDEVASQKLTDEPGKYALSPITVGKESMKVRMIV